MRYEGGGDEGEQSRHAHIVVVAVKTQRKGKVNRNGHFIRCLVLRDRQNVVIGSVSGVHKRVPLRIKIATIVWTGWLGIRQRQ